ncbi:MAG: ribosome silencing factor RsfS/YbeB/iojap [Acidimicrobiales bacterium]|nr:ribosome silencing factor RsfS/YbeB/iojap [Acidimicrobiales bacterium]
MDNGGVALDDIKLWVTTAARAAAAKKAADTVVLDVGDVLSITDAFVITSGSNRRQVLTIAEEVEAQVKSVDGPAPLRIEGQADAQWVLLDYGDFVVHVFLDEVRRYYDLERLWADAPVVEWDEGVTAAAGAE